MRIRAKLGIGGSKGGKNGCYLCEMCKDGGHMWKLGWNYGKVVEML